jgi:hypothetical protein
MATLSIEVEPFGGVSIENACRDAIAIADKLGAVVMFNFNGVRCMARPGDSEQSLAEDWCRVISTPRETRMPHNIAVGRPKGPLQ